MPSLSPEKSLEVQIRSALEKVAIIIVVVSDTIETRKWSRDEMSSFLSEADLYSVPIERLCPVFMPYDDLYLLSRWVKRLDISEPRSVLDPDRTELLADQDLERHCLYWDFLYGWFEHVSRSVVRAHAAFAAVRSSCEPLRTET
jgi:hypothetical protein